MTKDLRIGLRFAPTLGAIACLLVVMSATSREGPSARTATVERAVNLGVGHASTTTKTADPSDSERYEPLVPMHWAYL